MKYTVKIQDRIFEVEIEDLEARPVITLVDGEVIEVWPESKTEYHPIDLPRSRNHQKEPGSPSRTASAVRKTPPTTGVPAGNGSSTSVRAPIPGTVLTVLVKSGADVVVGQELLVLEAMKMKNTIRSPRSGKIAMVHVSPGQAVKHHDILLEFEE
jgi:biotin carboxyl carrier protein